MVCFIVTTSEFSLDNSHPFSSIEDHWSGEAPSYWHICCSYHSDRCIKKQNDLEGNEKNSDGVILLCLPSTVSDLWQNLVNIWTILVLWVTFTLWQSNFHQNVNVERPWQYQVLRQIYHSEKFSSAFYSNLKSFQPKTCHFTVWECSFTNMVSYFQVLHTECTVSGFTTTAGTISSCSICTYVPSQHLLWLQNMISPPL